MHSFSANYSPEKDETDELLQLDFDSFAIYINGRVKPIPMLFNIQLNLNIS